MEYVLARILLKLNILSNGMLSRAAVGEVTKDGVLSREWENGVEGGYASRAACLLRVNLGRKLIVRAESAFPTITDIVDCSRGLRHGMDVIQRL